MTGRITLLVDDVTSGVRLDRWLAEATGRARTEVQGLIAEGLVRVDGTPAAKSLKVVAGQTVQIDELHRSRRRPAVSVEVPVRFEDDHLAVVAKPAGLVVHRTSRSAGPTLVDALSGRMPLAPAAGEHRPGIVHRLDKGTSGLLVVAKTGEAYEALVALMKARQVRRIYRALVVGTFSLPTGRIEAPVGRSPRRPTTMSVRAGGRAAVTEFEVLEEMGEVSLLEVKLLTGRTHQIRVHLSHIHHPVVGDMQYGGGAEHLPAALGLRRPFLHAYALQLRHPVTGEELDVCEPLPDDLRHALAVARERSGQ